MIVFHGYIHWPVTQRRCPAKHISPDVLSRTLPDCSSKSRRPPPGRQTVYDTRAAIAVLPADGHEEWMNIHVYFGSRLPGGRQRERQTRTTSLLSAIPRGQTTNLKSIISGLPTVCLVPAREGSRKWSEASVSGMSGRIALGDDYNRVVRSVGQQYNGHRQMTSQAYQGS